MPTVDLSDEELRAIDFACMVLLEHARRGRKHLNDSATEGDNLAVEWYTQSLQNVDAARVTLRGLIAKAKETDHANQ